jgi:hypothetical protein
MRSRGSALETLVFVGFGVAALAFRQTNIFWVSVFFGGLQVVRRLRRATKTCSSAALADIVQAGSKNELYDPLVLDASLAGEHLVFWTGLLVKLTSHRLHQDCHIAVLCCVEQLRLCYLFADAILARSGCFRCFRAMEWQCRPRYFIINFRFNGFY